MISKLHARQLFVKAYKTEHISSFFIPCFPQFLFSRHQIHLSGEKQAEKIEKQVVIGILWPVFFVPRLLLSFIYPKKFFSNLVTYYPSLPSPLDMNILSLSTFFFIHSNRESSPVLFYFYVFKANSYLELSTQKPHMTVAKHHTGSNRTTRK